MRTPSLCMVGLYRGTARCEESSFVGRGGGCQVDAETRPKSDFRVDDMLPCLTNEAQGRQAGPVLREKVRKGEQ